MRYAPVDFAAVAAASGWPRTSPTTRRRCAALAAPWRSGAGALVDARVDPSGYGAVLRAIRG